MSGFSRTSRFLIIRLGSLGDVVHGIPAAAALRQRYPQAQIDWLVDPRYIELLDLVESLDRRIPFDPRDLTRGRGTARATLRDLRRMRYDAVIDLQGLLKSAVLARLVSARRTIGLPRRYLREPLARLFYSEAPDAGAAPHVIDRGLALLRALDVIDPAVRFPLTIPRTPAAALAAERVGSSEYALINPGAAWPNKRWPAERFGAAAAAVRAEVGLRSLVLWGPGERALADAVAAASSGAAVTAPETTIKDVVAVARGARVMVSGDTGPLHIAAAVGTPVVALFGPTFAERNGPWSPRDAVIARTDRCSCFYERRCRHAVPCIADIGVSEVVAAVGRCLTAHAR
ncbi:MAG: glycosyltransferase family 9 protein [Acidobacteria bacterium]|nr:glycosyltransferase family 9 protein [Acidobacteriota bacterium]